MTLSVRSPPPHLSLPPSPFLPAVPLSLCALDTPAAPLKVFTVDQRTRAILDRDLAFEDDAVRAKAYLLAAMADM